MYSMQGPAREAQSDSLEGQRVFVLKTSWVSWLIFFAWIGYVIWVLSQDEEFRLHLIHFTFTTLHKIAFTLGSHALALEEKYNGYIEFLH